MVKNLLTLLSTRQNNILSGATILMFAVFASKFLGLIKDRLLFHNFDTTTSAIFFASFRLPDLLFNLLIFGAIAVAFIPIYTDYLHKGEQEASEFASNILNLSLLVFGAVCLIGIVFVGPINSIFVPGFSGYQKEMTDILTRVILGAQLILVIGSFFIAISQTHQRFFISALAPLFYNIGIIIGILGLSPFFGILGPAFGVLIGAFLHVAIQLPFIKSTGFSYKFTLNFFDSGVREVFKMMSIRNIGLIAEQINESVGVALASLITPYSVTLLTIAQHLQVAPIALFGATIAQAALPVLSREHTKKEFESFKITLLTTLHQILFLTLPAAAILIVLRIPVVRLMFGADQFVWEDTILTGRTVAFLSAGLAAQAVILLLVRGFYALKDTKSPVIVSILTVILNIILSFIFVYLLNFEVWGLGLAYAISTNFSFVLLLFLLSRKVGGFDPEKLVEPALKMLLAAVVAAIALYIPIKALDQLVIDTTRTFNLLLLTGIASFFGIGVYLILVWLLKVEELKTYVNLVKRTSKMNFFVKTEEVIPEVTD